MPKRSSLLEPKLTSIRRSPRFLHLQSSPSTPKPTSYKPVFLSSLTPQSNPKNVSTTSGKKKPSMGLKKSLNGSSNSVKISNGSRRMTRLSGYVDGFDTHKPLFLSSLTPQSKNGSKISRKKKPSMGLNKSLNGSSNNVKSANGSRRMTRLSGHIDGFETCRRSPRFRNEGNCLINGLKKRSNLMGKEILDSPVTPVRNGERKLIEPENSDSYRKVSVSLDRRITRSQSRLMHRNIKVGKRVEDEQIGCNSLKRCTPRVNTRISCSERKENRIDSCKGRVSGSRNVSSSASLNHYKVRGNRKGRRNNVIDYSGNDSKVGNSDRRLTRRAAKHLASKVESVNSKSESERIFEGQANATRELPMKENKSKDCVQLEVDKIQKDTCDVSNVCHIIGRGEKKEQDSSKDAKLVGVKRKRNEVGVQGINQGWTKEQEVALQRAYFTARPSPHFWKKVSNLVPGKSAQECFDKVQSENQTPVFSKPASRTRKYISPSDILMSGCNLFKSAEKSKTKKNKSRSQATRKTVRHLLQKCCINQSDEADLFSILEPSVIPSSSECYQATPKNLFKSPDSSSSSMKRLSRFSNTSNSPLVSPPVLKKVKNMALHEKYIDLLHVRDHKRKVAFSRYSKLAQNQKKGEVNSVQVKDMIKAAKNALVCDAKDVIDKFRDSQANIMEAFSEEEFEGSDRDEDETSL